MFDLNLIHLRTISRNQFKIIPPAMSAIQGIQLRE